MEVAHGQPLHRREEEVRDRERRRRPLGVEVRPREPEDGQRPGGDGHGLDDEQQFRARPEPPERREQREDRVEVRAEPRDLLAVDVGDREHVAVRGRPDRLGHVAEIEAAAAEGPMPQDGQRAEAGGEGGGREPDEPRRRHRATSCSTRSAPPLAEHRLARLRPVGGEPAVADPARERGIARQPPHRRRQRLGVAGGDEQRALAVDEQLARGRRVRGDERRPAGERLERLVRDHAARLRRGAEDAERAARALDLLGQVLVLDPLDPLDVGRALGEQPVELAAADDAERDLGREPRRGEDRLDAVERDQLADEERVEVLRRLPPGPEEALLGADEADRQPFGGRARPARRDAVRSARCRRRRGRRAGARAGRPGAGRPQRASRPRSGRGPRRASRAARRAG